MNDYDSRLKDFNGRLPCPLKDLKLLKQVFTHRSFLNEPGGTALQSNERLEFLGDSILGAAISHMLYRKFSETDEGGLTRLRARLVNRRMLAGLAAVTGLNELMLLGHGEASSGGTENPKNLAGLFEAFIGALYIEAGFKKVFLYIDGLFAPLLEGVTERPEYFDYKPALQELTQKLFKTSPRYGLKKESGRPHERVFEVEVSVGAKVLGSGRGPRKKDAEQEAARMALESLKETIKEKKGARVGK